MDWIIGNHPDELTLWIPVIAARSNCKFVIIPCCFFDLDGKRSSDYHEKLGRYESYLLKVESMCRDCNFVPEREVLRIPSTKNVAILCRQYKDSNWTLDQLSSLLANTNFSPRISDKKRNEILNSKKDLKTTGKSG